MLLAFAQELFQIDFFVIVEDGRVFALLFSHLLVALLEHFDHHIGQFRLFMVSHLSWVPPRVFLRSISHFLFGSCRSHIGRGFGLSAFARAHKNRSLGLSFLHPLGLFVHTVLVWSAEFLLAWLRKPCQLLGRFFHRRFRLQNRSFTQHIIFGAFHSFSRKRVARRVSALLLNLTLVITPLMNTV